jgi:lipopolysaccharide/colanic/teichoic acid biosynthesis glycosyltransferase
MTNQAISKRAVDVIGSFTGLILTFPIMMFIASAILLKMGRPILYRQLRPGLKGKPFILYKFRTMMDLYNTSGELLSDQERLVGLGRFLRRASLDELPEFWNVLRGDMSLVGPRPLLMEYLERYNAEQLRRHDVKPGITGWAQIHGRNALSWEDKFMLDVWYVDHSSLWLDFKILCLTVVKILKKEGISAEGHATMPEFRGSGN